MRLSRSSPRVPAGMGVCRNCKRKSCNFLDIYSQPVVNFDIVSQKSSNLGQAGFSLAELLVVIAVIGVMAAIAVPNIGSITSHAYYAKKERNAQNVAMVAASARAAGAQNNWANVDQVLADVVNGIHVQVGNESLEFRVPLSDGERAELTTGILRVEEGRVVYDPSAAAN